MSETKKRTRIKRDPMMYEKIVITGSSGQHVKNGQRNKVKNWLETYSQTHYKGRPITGEAVKIMEEAKAYGIEIPENIRI